MVFFHICIRKVRFSAMNFNDISIALRALAMWTEQEQDQNEEREKRRQTSDLITAAVVPFSVGIDIYITWHTIKSIELFMRCDYLSFVLSKTATFRTMGWFVVAWINVNRNQTTQSVFVCSHSFFSWYICRVVPMQVFAFKSWVAAAYTLALCSPL